MRIDVDAGGYHSAAGALVGSNRTVAYSYSVLTSRLGGFGGMGGDDRSSEDFVAAYDDAAVEVCAGIADLTTALGNLGILSAASGENHRAANAGSACRQPARASSPVDREQPTKVSAYRPPSSLGGDPYGMPEFWDLIVDHLQGWTWPSADVSRLRQASSAWRSMAGALDRAPAQIREARAHLDTQRSPEIGTARAALFEVSQAADDLADECRSIADSCEEYATKVETTRETVKDLLRDLAIEIGATAVIGGIASAATFGGAALVGGGFAAGRASSCAAKDHHDDPVAQGDQLGQRHEPNSGHDTGRSVAPATIPERARCTACKSGARFSAPTSVDLMAGLPEGHSQRARVRSRR